MEIDHTLDMPDDRKFARKFWRGLAGILVLAVFIATLLVKLIEAYRFGLWHF